MKNNKEALLTLFAGETLVANERYYRINDKTKKVEYSDDKVQWQISKITLNEFLTWSDWQISQ